MEMEYKAGDRTRPGREVQADGIWTALSRCIELKPKLRGETPVSPIISNTRVTINYQSRDLELMESSG